MNLKKKKFFSIMRKSSNRNITINEMHLEFKSEGWSFVERENQLLRKKYKKAKGTMPFQFFDGEFPVSSLVMSFPQKGS